MRISDWSSDVCSSDLRSARRAMRRLDRLQRLAERPDLVDLDEQRIGEATADAVAQPRRIGDEKIVAHKLHLAADPVGEQLPAFEIILGHAVLDRHDRIAVAKLGRSEEHTSELQSLMRLSY